VFSASDIAAIALEAEITARMNPADSSPLLVRMVESNMASTIGIVCSGMKWETRLVIRVARCGIGIRASALAKKMRNGNSDIRKKNASAAEEVKPSWRTNPRTEAVTTLRTRSRSGSSSGSGPEYGSDAAVGIVKVATRTVGLQLRSR